MKRLLLSSMIALTVLVVQAQDRTISGRIIDDTGEALIGASVTIKGTSTGTVTDIDGNYSLSVPDGATLVISYVGYATQEVEAGARTSVDVTMASDAEQLGEVVVIGYGAVKKSDLTGSVATVSADDLNKGIVLSPDQALQGKVAGVQIINNSGQPGGQTTVRIRGNSSIRSGNGPLFVVDGIQLTGSSSKPGANTGGLGGTQGSNPLNFINPNDIQSIQVLKDASATAIYGSRGANGVVLITTKKGRSGAPKIEWNSQVGVSSVLRNYDILDANEYRNALDEFGVSGGTADGGTSTDAFDEITRNAITHSHNLSLSGGTADATYRVSLGFHDQQGTIKRNSLERTNVNMNASFDFLDDRGKIDVGLITTFTDEKGPPVATNSGFQGSLVSNALQWNPTYPLRDGNSILIEQPGVAATTINPLSLLKFYEDEGTTTDIVASISPSFKITDDLTFKTFYSVARGIGSRRVSLDRRINIDGIRDQGISSFQEKLNTNQIFNATLNYTTDISSSVSINAVVGYEAQSRDELETGLSASGFTVNGPYFNYFQGGDPTLRNVFSVAGPVQKLSSYFARTIFNINDTYLITATMRADGSSKFGANNQFGYFPSIGAAWNIHQNVDLPLDELKLRAGWGQTGNSEFDAGASQERWGINAGTIQQENAPNPDLKWETSTTINVGVDFALLDYKLTGSVDYFTKTTEDLLFQQEVIAPGPPGTRVWINLDGSEIVNNGVEVALNYDILSQDELTWNFGVNATFLNNEVAKYDGANVLYGQLFGQGASGTTAHRLAEGQPLNAFYMARFTGLDEAGVSTFANDGAAEYVGDPNQDVLLGINTTATYGKFSVAMAFNGAFGHDIYNNTLHTVLPITNLGTRNIASSLIGSDESTANAIQASSRYIEKGDYLKMNNLTIGYDLGTVGAFQNARLYLTGNNLFVITSYTGFDPEVNTQNDLNGLPSFGIEYIPYPSARTFMLGVNFTL